jgi:hypothetical protein
VLDMTRRHLGLFRTELRGGTIAVTFTLLDQFAIEVNT